MMNVHKIRPIRDMVLVVRDDVEEKTKGGIIIPNVGKGDEKCRKHELDVGNIVAIGTGSYTIKDVHIPMSVKPGDRVTFNTNSARPIREFNDNGQQVEIGIFLRNDEISGVIE